MKLKKRKKCGLRLPKGNLSLTGFTLLELLVVVAIVGVLSTFAVPGYFAAKERAIDRECQATLQLLQAAEKIYDLENDQYYPTAGSEGDEATINTDMHVDLKVDSTSWNWDYTVFSTGCVHGQRDNGPNTRMWCMDIADEAPILDGNGCVGGCN